MLIDTELIATCGMNCAICIGHLRDRNKCAGCNGDDKNKPKHCVICRIKNCENLKDVADHFCFACQKFPCARLRALDKRYRANYAMSMVDNLHAIQANGITAFAESETLRWRCSQCGELLSAHRDACLHCGAEVMKISDHQAQKLT